MHVLPDDINWIEGTFIKTLATAIREFLEVRLSLVIAPL
jgi:hypothetical protein